mmetsp:Transcript_51222/g.92068  ORF Transcript_51222/g.92068 Transcript_51222/m.92068 type:complete len:83 (-) Transcript_51222:9-257(-)
MLISTLSPGLPQRRRMIAILATPNSEDAEVAAANPVGPRKCPNCSAIPDSAKKDPASFTPLLETSASIPMLDTCTKMSQGNC